MELPIQLKFFRKLELYQEYKSSENKSYKTKRAVWSIEKKILKWATNHHHHLESPLNRKYIENNILQTRDPSDLSHLDPAMNNLCVKKFAKHVESGIEITLEGLMMGEVINDVEERYWMSCWYALFITMIWIIVVSGIFTIILEAINRLSELFW